MRIFASALSLLIPLFPALLPGTSLAQVCAVPGSDGPGTLSGIINTYYPGSGTAFAGSGSVSVGAIDGRGAATPIAAGDLVLIMQVQDALINTNNSSTYGGSSATGQGYTLLNSAGLYEYAVAAGPVSGGVLPLTSGLINTYNTGTPSASQGQRRFQVIRVPQYSTATITGIVTAPPWNGTTGGVVAFDVAGQLNWGGQGVNVTGRGFRGGGGQCSGSDGTGAPANANTDYVSNIGTGALNLGGTGNVPNGAKGEGIAGTPIIVFDPTTPGDNSAGTVNNTGGTDGTSGGYPGGSFGRGAPGNGGGGGTDGNSGSNDQNTGGAGGGSYSIGGKGGFGWTPGTPPGVDGGGLGGWQVPVSPARLFMGGGGGAGTSNNCTGTPGNAAASSGAAGGGIVLIRAGTVTGSGSITARGANANNTVGNDSSGGGGAGGNVLVFVNNGGAAIGASIDVAGGSGGTNSGGGAPHGPGGGGSGGYAAISGTATVNVAGGTNGTTATSTTSFPDYGSTTSSGGFQLVSLSASQIPGAGASPICYPRITVTKTTSTPTSTAGGTANYSITVSNATGYGTAQSLVVSDALPNNPNFTYASTSSIVLGGGAARTSVADPTAASTTPSWGNFSLPGGGSVTLNFVVNLAASVAAGTYQNPATVVYADPTRTTAGQTVTPGGTYAAGGAVPGSNYNSASSTNEDVLVRTPATIAKAFAPTGITSGGTSVLTITLTNANAFPLTGASLTDTYPAGLVNAAVPSASTTCAGGAVSATPAGTGVTLTGGTIPASGNCTITVTVTAASAQTYLNTIPVAALVTTEGVSNSVAATATLYAHPTVTKSFSPTSVATNADSTLTLVIANPNSAAMTLANPGLTDNFPANLTATGGAVSVTGAGCTGFAPATITAGATSLVLTAGTLPAGGSCTITLAVRSAVAGNYNNTTGGVITTVTPAGPASNTATLGVGSVTIAKTFLTPTIQSGGTSVLRFTLSNPTGVTQTGADFVDSLVNMSVAANQTVAGTCTGITPASVTAGQTVLSFTGISIPAGSCTVEVTVTSTNVGTNPNTSTGVATSTLTRGPSSNTANLTVVGPASISKAFSPVAIEPGAVSTLTFTLSNPNSIPLTGINFTDTYPAGLVNTTPLVTGGTCIGITTSAAAGGGTFNVTAGTLAAGSTCTITVQVTSPTPGSYSNTASGVSSAQSATGAGSAAALLTVLQRPTIAKTFVTSPIAQGGTSVLRFTLTNPNVSAGLSNLNFTDTLVDMSVSSATLAGSCTGVTHSPTLTVGETNLNFTVAALAGGANCTLDVTVTSSLSGTHPNISSGVRSTQTPTAGTPSNSASLVVLSPPSLQKNFSPGTIVSGGTSSIIFTVTNPQATALTNVQFSDTLVNMSLAAGTAVSETCSGAVTPTGVSSGSTSFSLALNTLAANESCTITVSNVTSTVVSPAGGHPNTTSTITSTQTAVNPGAAATGYLVVVVSPTVTKSFSPSAISNGGTSVVTFTVTNPNSIPLTDIRFTDNLPANLLNSAAQTFAGVGRGTCTTMVPSTKVAGNVDPITFSNINLAPGASCTVMMDVTSTTNGTYVNTVSNVLSDQTPTGVAGGSDTLVVAGTVNISVAKSFRNAAPPGGTVITAAQTNQVYWQWLSFTNSSGGAINNVRFTDTWAASAPGVTVNDGDGTGGEVFNITTQGWRTGTCTLTGTANTITEGATVYSPNSAGNDIDAVGAAQTCIVAFPVRSTTAGAKSNTVTCTNACSGADTANITIFAPATIAKAFSPATIGPGGTSQVTITLTNPAGNVGPLTNASFTDNLVNMSIAGNQAVGGTCAGTTPSSLTNGVTALSFSGITIPQNGSCTVTFTVTSSTVGALPNTASGVTSNETPTAGANSGAVNLTVVGTTLTKAFSPIVVPRGALSTLTFTIANGAGNPAQAGLAFTDTLPTNLQVASPNGAFTTCGSGVVSAVPGAGSISLSGGTMTSGTASCTVSVDVISNVAGTYNNLAANISGASTGMNTAGVNASLTVQNNPTVTKAFNPTSIAANGTSQLTFTITAGAGAQGLTGLGFTDTLPANLVIASPNGLSNACGGTVTAVAGSDTISLSNGPLSAAPASCTISVNVTSPTLGTYLNNSANFSGLAGGLTAGTANATLNVVGTTLTKAFSPTEIGTGGTSTLTFTITNGAGNPAQTGLSFTENLPTNIVVAATPAVTNTCGGTVTAVAGATSFNIAGGALAASAASCTFSVNVTGATPGSYPNTGSRISGAPTSMNTSTVNATLNVLARPVVTKTFASATMPVGGTTALSITLSNPNNLPITGVAFTDLFPTSPGQMAIATPLTVSNTCGGTLDENDAVDGDNTLEAGDGSVRLSGGTIPANGSCVITVNITAATAGSYSNAIGVGDVTSTNAGSNTVTTSAPLTVLARPTVAKAYSPNPVAAGAATVLTITLTNPNTGTAITGAAFTDNNPAGVLNTATPTGATTCGGTVTAAANGNSVALSGGTIPANGSCTVTVNQSAATEGAYANTIAIGDVTTTNAGSNTVAANATLNVFAAPTISKAFGANIGPGGSTTLTFTLGNPAGNPAPFTGLGFTDVFPVAPGAMTLANISTSTTCTGATILDSGGAALNAGDVGIQVSGISLNAGATCTVQVNVTAPTAGSYNNTSGTVSATGPLSITGGTAAATLTVVQPTLTKAFSPTSFTLAGTTTLVFTMTNGSGNPAQSGLGFVDTLRSGLVVAAVPNIQSNCPAGGALAGSPAFVTAAAGSSTITVSNAAMNAAVASCEIRVDVTTSGTPVVAACPQANNTNAAADISGLARLTNSVGTQCVTVTAATPVLTKAFSPTTVTVGGTSTLTFTVTQPAGNPTQTFSFTDTLPAGLVIAGTPNVGGTCSNGTVTATAGSSAITVANRQIVNPATTCTITVDVTTSNTPTVGACPQANNTNGAANISGTTNLTNSVTSQCVTVNVATPTLNKAFSGALTVGSTSTLTFTVSQPTGNPTQTFSFTDTLPAGLRIAATPNVGGTCSGGTVTATAGSNTITVASRQIVNPATTCTITVDVTTTTTPTTGTCPQANNTNGSANISATTNLTAAVTNSAAGGGTSTTGACVTVNAATPSLNKAFSGALTVGGTSTLTFTVTQPAGNPTQTFSFTDTLPAGLRIAATPNVGGTCSGGTVTATAGSNTITVASRQIVNPATTCTITVDVTTTTTPTAGTCPQANNTNGNANISATTNLTAAVTNSAAGGGTSTTGACVTVNAATPTLNKQFSGALTVGGTVNLTFTVTQPAGNPTQTFSFTDTLPAGLVVGSGAVGGTCSGGTVTATAGTNTITVANRQIVNPATTCTITVPVTTTNTPTVATCPQAANTNGAANISGTTNLTSAVTNSAAGGGTSTTGACVTVNAATPALTKAFSPTSVVVGGTSTLTFTVTQPAGNPTQTFSFTDTLPAGLRIAATPNVGGTCSIGAGSRTATAGGNTITITSNQIVNPATTCTITVDVTTTTTPTVAACPAAANTNGNGSISATTNVTNNVTDQCLTVNAATPSLNKAFSGALTVGGTSTLTFTVTQPAGNPTQTFSFTDTLPAGLRIAATPNVGGTCSGGTVTATAGSNTITVASRQIVNPATTCTITVDVTTTTTPTTGTCPQANNTNGSANISATTNVTAAVTNSAAGGGTSTTGACVTVNAATPVLTKAFSPATIGIGGTTTLTFTVTQPAGNPTQTFSFTDTLPAGLVVATTPNLGGTCSIGAGSRTATAGSNTITITSNQIVNPATTCTLTVDITTSGTPTIGVCPQANNTNGAANISATTNLTNSVTSQCVSVAQASLAKTFGSGTIDDGVATSLVFTLTNGTGNPAQSGLAWTETLPTSLRFTAASLPVAYSAGCSGPATVTATGAPLNAITVTGVAMTGGTTSCTVTIGVNGTSGVTNVANQFNASCAATPAAFTNTTSNITGTTRVTNSVTSQCLVVNSKPTLTKSFGANPQTIGVGQTATLTFTIDNTATGNIARSGLAFTDTLPGAGGLTATAAAAQCGGTVAVTGGNVISLTGGSLAAGATCTLTATVTGVTPGSYVNGPTNGSITGVSTNLNNGVTDQTLNVVQPTLTKSFGVTSLLFEGARTSLIFVLTNGSGNPAQGGLGWTETLPASLQFTGASLPVAYGAGCSGPATVSASGAPNLNQIVLSGISMSGGTASCTVTVGVNSVSGVTSVSGQYNASCLGNPAAFTNTSANITGETRVTNGATPQCLVVNSMPTLTKAFGTPVIGIGQTTTLTFTINNNTPAPLNRTGIVFSDALPAGLVVANPPVATTGAGCAAATLTGTTDGSTSFGATGLSVNAGQSCVITVSVRGATLGAKTNTTASVTVSGFIINSVTDQTVTVVQPDVAKTFGASSFNDGGTTTLVFTLTNGAGNPAQAGIALGDTLPSGLRFTSTTPAVTYSAGCSGPATAAYDTGTRVLSGLTGIAMTGGTTSCTVTVAGLTNEPGQNGTCPGVAAQTNLAANVTATNATNTSTDQCVSITRINPNVAKTFGAGTITDGSSTTLVFTLTNQGTNPAQSGISVGDTLPTGLRFTTTTPAVTYSAGCSGPATAAYNTGTRVLSGLTGIAMTNGTASCTVTIAGLTNATGQTGTCPGVAAQTNLAANVTATNATNTSTDQCLTVTPIAPNVAKTFGAGSFNDGASTTLVFTLTNQGTNPAQSGISLGDTLPTGLRFTSTTPAVTYSAGCSGPATAAYATGTRILSGLTGIAMTNGTTSCTVTIAGLTNEAGQVGTCPNAAFTNLTANVTTTGATNTSTDQCVSVNRINPNVAKTFGAGTITDGNSTTLIFTLTNQGTNPAQSGISLGDTLPTGLRFTSTTPAVTYSAGCSGPATAAYNTGTRVLSGLTGIAMTNGTTSCTVTIAGLTNAAGQVGTCPNAAQTNLAANVTTTGATNTSTDQCVSVTATPPTAAKTFGAALINDGATTTLIFTLTNQGTNPAQSGISLGDTLPSGLRFTTTTPAVSYSAGCSGPATASYNTGSRVLSGLTGIAISNGTTSCTVTVAGLTNEVGQVGTCPNAAFTNQAVNVTTTGATNTSTDQCLTIRSVDLTVTKTHSGNFTVGVNGVYTITVSNGATSPATSGTITVTDTLPSSLGFVSATGSGWSCGAAGQVVTCTTAASIAGGASAPAITLTVSVSAAAQPQVANTAIVSGGGEPAPNTGNNTATDIALVNIAATNQFLTDGALSGLPGATLFYPHTFIAGLTGTVSFSTTNITSPNNPAWTQAIYRDLDCNGTLNGSEGASLLTGTIAVNPGDQVCIIVRDAIPANAPVNAQNQITVTATFNGTLTYTRTDITTVGGSGSSGLTLAKTVRNVTQGGTAGTSNQARPGDTLEYIITYTNNSSSPITQIVINDSTPSFTRHVSATCGTLPANLLPPCNITQPAVNGTGAYQWAIPNGSLAPGQSGTVTFTVTVQP